VKVNNEAQRKNLLSLLQAVPMQGNYQEIRATVAVIDGLINDITNAGIDESAKKVSCPPEGPAHGPDDVPGKNAPVPPPPVALRGPVPPPKRPYPEKFGGPSGKHE
jgi:hypothetical protein